VPAQGAGLTDEQLTDIIAAGLSGTYHCTRVWEAWSVGTMSQDDFEPVDESDTPGEIAQAIRAAITQAPAAEHMQAHRAAALEEAAKVCEDWEKGFRQTADGASDGRYDWKADGAGECAAAIRELSKMD
jgi:hypothetical protein